MSPRCRVSTALVLVVMTLTGCGVTTQRQAHIVPDDALPPALQHHALTSTTSTTIAVAPFRQTVNGAP